MHPSVLECQETRQGSGWLAPAERRDVSISFGMAEKGAGGGFEGGECQKTRQGQWLGQLPPSTGKGLRAGQGVSISFGMAENKTRAANWGTDLPRSATFMVIPGAALPWPRLGRVGGYIH